MQVTQRSSQELTDLLKNSLKQHSVWASQKNSWNAAAVPDMSALIMLTLCTVFGVIVAYTDVLELSAEEYSSDAVAPSAAPIHPSGQYYLRSLSAVAILAMMSIAMALWLSIDGE